MAQDLPQSVADRRTASLFLVVILATVLLDLADSAPMRETHFWKDACSLAARTRHGRSPPKSIVVRSQLRHAIAKMNIIIKRNLTSIFPKGKYLNTNSNKPHCLDPKKFLKQMRKNRTEALGLFHENLQAYAGAIYSLNNVKIKSSAKIVDEQQRTRIFDDVSSEIKLLLCETVRQLEEDNKSSKVIDLDTKCNNYEDPADYTGAGINYHLVFGSLKRFLKGSQKILYGAKKGNATNEKRRTRPQKKKQVKS